MSSLFRCLKNLLFQWNCPTLKLPEGVPGGTLWGPSETIRNNQALIVSVKIGEEKADRLQVPPSHGDVVTEPVSSEPPRPAFRQMF